jgi:dTDP-4-dehydrorhamnose 3,5-epimerase
MRAVDTYLAGIVVIEPEIFRDTRGFFFETYHQRKFAELGLDVRFVQDNHSRSEQRTLRGLHYQLNFPQAKLCRVVVGEVLDVVVDIQLGSPTFGKWIAVILSAENKRQIFIPRGFAHGFVVRSNVAEFLYKCDEFYHPEDEYGLAWNDPSLAIPWGVADPIISTKDRNHPALSAIAPMYLPRFQPSAK